MFVDRGLNSENVYISVTIIMSHFIGIRLLTNGSETYVRKSRHLLYLKFNISKGKVLVSLYAVKLK